MTGPIPSRSTESPDPWKGFRGVMAGTLVLEAIVVLLALPVVAVVGRGLTTATGGYVIGLAALLIVLSGLQRRPWLIWVDLVGQLAVIAGVIVHPAIGFIGAVFLAVWLLIAYLRADVARRQKRGLLPGQRPPD
ncbi:MAG TPA: DUF4233 domain-containing protein [Mycobacterium sp.]|nr:DUF4233 domain-containing protein [Mycobacterium sp.]